MLCLLSILGVVLFAPKTYATSYFQPRVYFKFAPSRYICSGSNCWWQYGTEYNGSGILDSYDSTTGIGNFHFDLGSSWQSWCNGYSCVINIIYIQIQTYYYQDGSYVQPDYTDPMLHIKYISPYQFYIGDGTDINYNFTGQHRYFNVLGGDVRFGSWSDSSSLCLSQGADICMTRYYEDLQPGSSKFTAIMDFDTSEHLPAPYSYYFTEYPYDTVNDVYIINNSIAFFQQFEYLGADTNLSFQVQVYTDSIFSSSGDGENIEDALYRENEIINQHINDAQSAAGLLSFSGFNVPWIFSAWFNLFINNDCVNIPILAGMLHTNNSQVCSPWYGSGVREILTPIFSMLASLLAFGFVVRWLSNSHDLTKDDLNEVWYGK